jgi:hypothetical protein
MVTTWVDAVGGSGVVSALAAEVGLSLDTPQYTLLESFGALVEAAVLGRAVGSSQVSRAAAQLNTVTHTVRNEVEASMRALPDSARSNVLGVRVCERMDTGLPVVYVVVAGAPKLVVFVGRAYCANGTGVSYGFKGGVWQDDTGKLKGAAAVAAGRLDDACRRCGWQVTVSTVITEWVVTAIELISSESTLHFGASPALLLAPGMFSAAAPAEPSGNWNAGSSSVVRTDVQVSRVAQPDTEAPHMNVSLLLPSQASPERTRIASG